MRRPRASLSLISLALGLAAATVGLAPDGPRDPNVGTSYRIPFKVTATNHFLVRVRVNGKGPFNFLVDTGAPALYVGTDAAKAAGIEAGKDEFWAKVDSLEFEGGAVLKGMKARVEDPFQLVGMNALGLPGASIDGILGYTALARFKIELDPSKDRMTWTRLDFEPTEPFIPRGAIKQNAPAGVQAMNLMGPLAKGMAALVGKQEPDRMLPRGGLGVELKDTDGGVEVVGIVAGSPAAKGGVQLGDRIVHVAAPDAPAGTFAQRALSGRSVANARAAVGSVRPGGKVALKVRRGDRTVDLSITAGEGF